MDWRLGGTWLKSLRITSLLRSLVIDLNNMLYSKTLLTLLVSTRLQQLILMREHTELYQDYLGWGLQDKADSFSHFHGSIGRYPIFVVKLQGLNPYKTEVLPLLVCLRD